MKSYFKLIFLSLFSLSQNSFAESQSLAAQGTSTPCKYVDPRIGTGDHGHVFIGANVPFGMVQAGPTEYQHQWDWCSGYHFSSDSIIGFSQLHLSGTGCGDLGDIGLMPAIGSVECSRKGLAQTFSHDNEEARPGYYRVTLNNGIRCEMTATARVALHRYTFPGFDKLTNHGFDKLTNPQNDQSLVIDLENTVSTWDKTSLCRFQQLDDSTIIGFRHSKGWANNQKLFYKIQLSRPIKSIEYRNPARPNAPGKQYAVVRWDEKYDNEPLLVKISLSPTSEANAIANMQAELPGWDFTAVENAATSAWNKELSRIKATFPTERESRIFYTALFHLMVAPQLWCDVNGDYMGADGKVHYQSNFNNVTTLSFWDTYRAANPLSTIIFPDKSRDYAHTLMNIWRQTGELPVWHLMSCETYCMVGEPAVPILADILLKDQLADIDKEEAYKAMVQSLQGSRGKRFIAEYGYIPFDNEDNESETVGKNMEYFLAFWSAAQVAGRLGHKEDSVRLTAISLNYKKLYDKRVGFMRAIDKNGDFRPLTDFNPNHQTHDYTEGNPWQYTFLVPHDVNGLIELMGGAKAFEKKLDSLFLADSQLNADAAPDVSGLIGQYAHGNEPSHHILYMYNYIGKPQKGQKMIRRVMDELYDDKPAGLCGNEDVGQMSAWYIMSALGFYQVEPCGGKYQLGCPAVREATFAGFTIRTKGNPKKGIVKSWKLNGKALDRTYITHDEIMKGGVLECAY